MLQILKKNHLREVQVGCAALARGEFFSSAEVGNPKRGGVLISIHRLNFTCVPKSPFNIADALNGLTRSALSL